MATHTGLSQDASGVKLPAKVLPRGELDDREAELEGFMASIDHALRLPWEGDRPQPGDVLERVGGRVFYILLEAQQQLDGLLLMRVRRVMKRPEPAPGGRVWMLPD